MSVNKTNPDSVSERVVLIYIYINSIYTIMLLVCGTFINVITYSTFGSPDFRLNNMATPTRILCCLNINMLWIVMSRHLIIGFSGIDVEHSTHLIANIHNGLSVVSLCSVNWSMVLLTFYRLLFIAKPFAAHVYTSKKSFTIAFFLILGASGMALGIPYALDHYNIFHQSRSKYLPCRKTQVSCILEAFIIIVLPLLTHMILSIVTHRIANRAHSRRKKLLATVVKAYVIRNSVISTAVPLSRVGSTTANESFLVTSDTAMMSTSAVEETTTTATQEELLVDPRLLPAPSASNRRPSDPGSLVDTKSGQTQTRYSYALSNSEKSVISWKWQAQADKLFESAPSNIKSSVKMLVEAPLPDRIPRPEICRPRTSFSARSSRRDSRLKALLKVPPLLIVLNMTFVFFNLPLACWYFVSPMFSSTQMSPEKRDLIDTIMWMLVYTNSAISAFVQSIYGPKFRENLWRLIVYHLSLHVVFDVHT